MKNKLYIIIGIILILTLQSAYAINLNLNTQNIINNLVNQVFYSPFGSVLDGDDERYMYTGQELDDTGLQYYGARYYDSSMFHFTQPDPIIADMYDPQNLNRFSYVRNNPYKYVDPSGNSPTLVTGVIGAAVGAVIGGGFSAGSQYYHTGTVGWGDVGKSAGVGAVAGGVAGLTLGMGTAVAGAAGLSGTGAVAAEGAVAAGSSITGGQAARATENVIEGNAITEGLGNPGDMALDGTIGLVTFGVGKGVSSARSAAVSSDIKILNGKALITYGNLLDDGAGDIHHTISPQQDRYGYLYSRVTPKSSTTPHTTYQMPGTVDNIKMGSMDELVDYSVYNKR